VFFYIIFHLKNIKFQTTITKHNHNVKHILVFGIMVAFCGCDLKKVILEKNTFNWGWFGIYIYLIKTIVEIEVEQKVV
jgi:hypothetical protein